MPGLAGYGINPVNRDPRDQPPTQRIPISDPSSADAFAAGHTAYLPVPGGGYGNPPGAGPGRHGASRPDQPGFGPQRQGGPGYPPPPYFGGGPPAGGKGKKQPPWLIPAIAGAAALALVLTLLGGVMVFAGEVPGGTTVLGVNIGGRTVSEAADALKKGLGKRVDEPVPLRIGKSKGKVDPAKVGLKVDYVDTARKAAEGWPNPFTVLFGERTVAPVVSVDAEKLDKKLQKLAASSTQKLSRPAIQYRGLTPKPTYPGSGKGLDVDRSAQAFQDSWLRSQAVTVPIVEIKSVTSRADVDRMLKKLAKPAVSAPVTVTTSKGDVTIEPEAIAKSLIMESDEEGEIIPEVDTKKLGKAARDALAEVETPAKDAKIEVKGGDPVTSGERAGKEIDMGKLAKDMLPVLRKPDSREVQAKLVEAKPKLTEEKIGKLGIKEKISSFTTYFPGGEDRNKNILVIADEVDNALVMPGKTFSLNGYTGERSYAQGYVDAPVIIDGKIKNYVGGGISQFATTTFNAAYYAALEDVYHQPHGYYISRYPSVIEATVFYPSLDLKFKNDSQYGVLIDTSYTDSSVTVSMWSTKRYDIKTKWGKKRDHTQPKTVHLKEKDCLPTTGIPGFKQSAWRIFRKDGEEVKRE
ncbi:MAG: VanW family protein, partial [Micromonosporaceae bacterium]